MEWRKDIYGMHKPINFVYWCRTEVEMKYLMPINVFIIDDDELILESLAALLKLHTAVHVAGLATTGADAIPRICSENPDIIIVDAVMPAMDGFEVTRLLLQKRPLSQVIILSSNTSPSSVAQALTVGARGYVDKSRNKRFLFEAIQAVSDGGVYFPAEVSFSASEVAESLYQSSNATNQLSQRERQVLDMVVHGATSLEIASQLKLSVHTVDTYRSRIKSKIGAENTADLVKIAIRQGLVDS
jgi:two-component system, NarL family, nitrate/nitrite response regulator NarL